MAIKILIGGSPCTHWSIAQKNNRETEPSGMGWQDFRDYMYEEYRDVAIEWWQSSKQN